jgi:phospholysine phosphohistidine inorganic pyrophosphate phosphatase
MSAVLFDLDGVLYQGDHAIAGAADVIDWFEKHSIPHLFVTNTTSKPRSALVAKLAGFGIHTRTDQYLTPPVAALELIKRADCHRLALFIPESTQDEFSAYENLTDENDTVDAVIIGDLAHGWNFATINRAFRILMNNPGAIFIALGMTRYWRTDEGLQLDAGPFIAALEYATGRKAVVTGKPARDFFSAATALLGEDGSVYMIGDDIQGDIRAAQSAGLNAIQVRTGKFSESDLHAGVTPDALLDSIADLPGWWLEHT